MRCLGVCVGYFEILLDLAGIGYCFLYLVIYSWANDVLICGLVLVKDRYCFMIFFG